MLTIFVIYLRIILFQQWMKPYKSQKQKKTHQLQICAVKLSNFDVPLQPIVRKEFSENQKIMRRRQNVKTPFLTKKEENFELSSERYLRTSQQSRLSSFIEGQIHQLHQNNDRFSHFSSLARDKINQLKTIMNLKQLNMRKALIKEKNGYHFREYKLNKRQNEIIQEPFSLHSRNIKNSPFTKSIKAKRLLSKSMQLKNPSILFSTEYKSIQVGSQSKYGKIKKLVLLGGSLNSKVNNFPNPEYSEMQRRTSTGYNYYNRFIRQSKASHHVQNIQQTQNDCQPWQTYKGENMYEQNAS